MKLIIAFLDLKNIKIVVAVSITFVFIFSLLILSEQTLGKRIGNEKMDQEILDSEFFYNDFSKNRTMFLIGSSHVGQLNVTKINDIILSKARNSETPITVYNLATSSSIPVRELTRIDQITSLQPEILFYGLSYRDFKFPPYVSNDIGDSSLLPDIKSMASEALSSNVFDMVPLNPQLLTRNLLRDLLGDEFEVEKGPRDVTIPKTPFFTYLKNPVIASDNELKREIKYPARWTGTVYQHENIDALHKFVQHAKNNDIDLVIFLTPLQKYYLESLSESQKRNLNLLVDEMTKKYGIKIYDFREKYVELNIWQNNNHVSIHPNVTQYNKDIAEMIIAET